MVSLTAQSILETDEPSHSSRWRTIRGNMETQNHGPKPRIVFLLCLIYAVHMLEEFSLGFVEWANRYFGNFDWNQNIIGNSIYLVLLTVACSL